MPLGQLIPQMMKRIFEMAKSPKTDFAKPRRGSPDAFAAYIAGVDPDPMPIAAFNGDQGKIERARKIAGQYADRQTARNFANLKAGKPLSYGD